MNGRRTVYIPVTKRADASTLASSNEVKANLPTMQAVVPDDIKVSFEFDQSPYVTPRDARVWRSKALLGAVLTGLMVLLFLRDWRSALDRRAQHSARAAGGGGRAVAQRARRSTS